MLKIGQQMQRFSNLQPHKWMLDSLGFKSKSLIFNPSIPQMYEIAIAKKQQEQSMIKTQDVSSNGAFCAYSKPNPSISQNSCHIVKNAETDNTVNWNQFNLPISSASYSLVEDFAIDYLNHAGNCIIVDGYVGADVANRLKVRAFCQKSYHALFMHNMLIKPTKTELLQDFSKGIDINIFNASQFQSTKSISNIQSQSLTALNLSSKNITIMGNNFAPTMKHSLFKLLQYYYPRKNILPLKASAIVQSNSSNKNKNENVLFFGLQNLNMNVLELVNKDRKYLANDELCWGQNGLFNVEGGCYTKIRNQNNQVQGVVKDSIRYGALVQNAIFYPNSRNINYYDVKESKNAMTSFPLNFMKNAHIGPTTHPSKIVFLTCDSMGILPPIFKLTPEQALYHFLSGYSSKIDELDQNNCIMPPQLQFNQCFGEQHLALNPANSAKMLYDKIIKHGSDVWVINSGWVQGKYGQGRRLEKEEVQLLMQMVMSDQLKDVQTHKMQYFNFDIPCHVEGIQQDWLYPQRGWVDKNEFDEQISKLVISFAQNFHKKFKGKLGEIQKIAKKGSPTLI